MVSGYENKRLAGFSLLELFASITLLVVGLISFGGVFLSTSQLTDQNQDNNLVTVAVRNAVQTLEGADFTALVTEFGPGSGKEKFWCPGDGALVFTDPGNAEVVGKFTLYNDEKNIPASFASLSGNGDINANLVIDTAPVTDYVVLPVRIELDLVNANPARVVTVDIVLVDK